MKYFQSLPLMLKTNDKGQTQTLVNLTARAGLIQSLLNNPLMFYSYDVQEGETPEIIAHRYYDDSYRYWLILFANQMLDAQWDWPLTSQEFEEYMLNFTDPYTTVHHYEKIITQYDSLSMKTTVNKIVIGQSEYDSLVESTQTVTFPSSTVTITTTKNAESVYEYEYNLNESKRTIKVIKQEYAPKLEEELATVMGTLIGR
jgi:hypothetical protein